MKYKLIKSSEIPKKEKFGIKLDIVQAMEHN